MRIMVDAMNINPTTTTALQPSSTSAGVPNIFERLSRGEAGAFEDFVEQYGKWVACVVRRSLRWRTGDFDDAMQEAMLALFRAAPSFDRTRGAETTFIATVVRHLMIKLHRKASSCPGRVVADSADLAEDENDHGAGWTGGDWGGWCAGGSWGADAVGGSRGGRGTNGGSSRHDHDHHLHKALRRLQPQERELVELAIVGGKTHAQIAQATGLSRSMIKRTIQGVLTRLRRELTSQKAAA